MVRVRRSSDASLARYKWKSFPSVQITEVMTKKDGNAEIYSAFKIVVKDGPDTWTIFKRYSNFVELHSKLKDSFLEESLPTLPIQKWGIFDFSLLWREDHTNESRRISLEQYLHSLLSDAQFFQSSEVRAFLEPDEYPVHRKSRVYDDIENMFLLPPPPACARRIPQIVIITNSKRTKNEKMGFLKDAEMSCKVTGDPIDIKLSTSPKSVKYESEDVTLPELCHVSYLLNSIKDCLEYFTELQKDLRVIKGTKDRLQYLEDKRNKIDSTVDTLKKEQGVLVQLLRHPDISSNPDLTNYFNTCAIQVNKGLEWYAKTEDTIMEKLYIELHEKYQKQHQTEITHKIVKFEERAEDLIIDYLERSNSEETQIKLSELETQIMDMLGKVEKSVDPTLISRLKNILKYLQDNFGGENSLESKPVVKKEPSIEDLD